MQGEVINHFHCSSAEFIKTLYQGEKNPTILGFSEYHDKFFFKQKKTKQFNGKMIIFSQTHVYRKPIWSRLLLYIIAYLNYHLMTEL